LTYVASGSIVKRSLSLFTAFRFQLLKQADYGRHETDQKVRQKNKKRQKVSSVAVGPDSVPYRQLGTLVRLTYVASRSVVKRRSLNMNNEEKKKRKHRRLVEQIADDMKRIADDTKRIADGTKQNKKRQKVYAVPRGSQFCKSGLGILRKGEVIP
ncbi:hypothetical protein T05_12621, partial [Trichinella murrelli]